MNHNPHLDKHAVAESFGRYAASYDEYAFIQQEIGQRLLARAQTIKTPPRTILDLGAGPGSMFKALAKTFPKAKIVGLDIAWGMCAQTASSRSSLFKAKPTMVQADMEQLPFKDNSFDLVFSNCAIQWACQLPQLFAEVNRVLTAQGGLFYSSFGPDTLSELKQLWAQVSPHHHIMPFLDLQGYGDLMFKHFSQPVVSSDAIYVTYKTLNQHLTDLKMTGARNVVNDRKRGLSSPRQLAQLKQAFEKAKGEDGLFTSTFEVVFGHAFKAARQFTGVQPVPIRLIK